MQKIIEYRLESIFICGCDGINELIKNGWQPFGSVAINNDGVKYQPMVKYGEVDEWESKKCMIIIYY